MNRILERIIKEAQKTAKYQGTPNELSIDTNNALNAIMGYDKKLTPEKECHKTNFAFVGGLYKDESCDEYYDVQGFVYQKINTPTGGLRDALGMVATWINVSRDEKTNELIIFPDEKCQYFLVEYADDSKECMDLIRAAKNFTIFEGMKLVPTNITDYNQFIQTISLVK